MPGNSCDTGGDSRTARERFVEAATETVKAAAFAEGDGALAKVVLEALTALSCANSPLFRSAWTSMASFASSDRA